jgi:GAF domain-containing protein
VPVSVDRRAWLWGQVVERAQGGLVTVDHVCAVAVAAAGADRAAVTVVLSATPRETIHVTDWLASDLEELTLIVGEGPGVDALEHGPVLVADLMADHCSVRWPAFTPGAVQAGTRAVFAFPLRVGAIRLGVMSLYRTRPGALDSEQLADALLLADTACALLLDAAPRNQLGLDGRRPEQAAPQDPEVHQATGMIAVQLGVTATVALSRLRAYAYAHDRRLRDVAADVLARRLRFDTEPEPNADAGTD